LHDRRILVTGGAGFVGSHIVDALVRKGATVHVLDNLSTGRRENLPDGVHFFRGDLLDRTLLDQALDGVDEIIHLAARVAIRDSLAHFQEDAQTNLLGTLMLLDRCRAHRVRKFLFSSSMAVYADSPEPLPIPESYPQEPISPYGLSKLAAERYIRLLAGDLGMHCVCLRYFNVYGPRQAYTPYVGVITIFIENLLQGMPPVIFGNGEQQRDFVFVGDVARATLLALDSDLKCEVLNVGTGQGTSVNQIARLLIEKLNPNLQPVYEPSQPGEIRHSIADISRIRDKLGYRPQGRIEERICDVIAWKQARPVTS
jgi:UDP-glucose 4-epimerase